MEQFLFAVLCFLLPLPMMFALSADHSCRPKYFVRNCTKITAKSIAQNITLHHRFFITIIFVCVCVLLRKMQENRGDYIASAWCNISRIVRQWLCIMLPNAMHASNKLSYFHMELKPWYSPSRTNRSHTSLPKKVYLSHTRNI